MTQFLDTDMTGEFTGEMPAIDVTEGSLLAVRLRPINQRIFRALLSLASANLLIRVAGMLNQIVVTFRFGQGAAMDAYFVASTVPTLLAQLLSSALESSVIPVYARLRTTGTKEQVSTLFSTLLNVLVIGLVLLTIIMLLFRSQVVFLSAAGLDPLRKQLSIGLTPYIFPVLLLMTVNSFLACLLNTEGQFGWPAYAGIVVPITTVTLVLYAGSTQGVVMLCIGTLIGQVIQLAVIIIRARMAGIVYRPVLDLRNTELATIFVLAWPALFSALISQASPLVDQVFASFLSAGSISALNYSNKLISVFTGVIIASVGRAILPYLSRQAGIKDFRAFKVTLRLYVWAMAIATVLLTAVMIVLAYPLVRILFQRGAFTANDTVQTSIVLLGFVLGLAPMAIGFIIAKAFSALGKTRILMYVTIFSVFTNALFDYLLSRLWQSFGIALATSLVYTCTVVLLVLLLRREIGVLDLFTPPREIRTLSYLLSSRRDHLYQYIQNNYIDGISYHARQLLVRTFFILVVFAAGIVGVFIDATYTLKIAFGSLLIFALMRYRYVLLIMWVLIDAFIGSTVPFFNGNNFLSGLTAPTLLLLFYLPVKQAFKRMPALAFFLAFLIWQLLGIGLSPTGIGAFLTLWTTFLDFVGIAVLVIFVLTTRQRLLRLVDAILLVSVIIALYGIYGYFVKKNGIPDASIPSLFRISSIFSNTPPTLALFLSIVLPLSLYRVTVLTGFKRLIGMIVALILLAALGLTFTRGAFISVPLSILVMILLLPSRRMKVVMLSSIVALAAIAAIVVVAYNIPVFDRFFNNDLTTLNGRTVLWSAILDHFDPTKLLGNGLKASDQLLAQLQIGYGGGIIATATHNIFLETMYDNGIIGAVLLALTFIVLALTVLRKLRGASAEYRMLLATCLAVFINVIMQSIESNDFWNNAVGIYFWIIMALPFALYWTAPKPTIGDKEEAAGTKERSNHDGLPTIDHELSLPAMETEHVEV